MSSIAEIRHHLKVIDDTHKITRAMYMISSSKMRKAVAQENRNLVYFNQVRSDIRYLLESVSPIDHPYFKHRSTSRAAYLVIAADKGMCGGYNANVLNLAYNHMKEHDECYLLTVGQMTREYFERLGIVSDIEFLHVIQAPNLEDARNITFQLTHLYETGQLDEVYVVYTHMDSMAKQTPRVLQMLPVVPESFSDAELFHEPSTIIDFHPSPKAVLDVLVPQYLIGLTYATLVQSYASEQCARMAAMDASNRNADEMSAKLTIELNRARQAAITQELTEIIAGADSMAQVGV